MSNFYYHASQIIDARFITRIERNEMKPTLNEMVAETKQDLQFYRKRDSGTAVFLWISRHFQNNFSLRTPPFAASEVMRFNSELKNLEPSDISLPEGTKLFINESLCPYYKAL